MAKSIKLDNENYIDTSSIYDSNKLMSQYGINNRTVRRVAWVHDSSLTFNPVSGQMYLVMGLVGSDANTNRSVAYMIGYYYGASLASFKIGNSGAVDFTFSGVSTLTVTLSYTGYERWISVYEFPMRSPSY